MASAVTHDADPRGSGAPTVIVGVDASDRARDAVALAHAVAEPTGARLLLAGVYVSTVLGVPGEDVVADVTLRARAEGAVEGAATVLPAGARWEQRIMLARSPARGLHDLAEQEEADLVVVGSTHRGTIGQVLPGSTGERVLHAAPCSVAMAPHGYSTIKDRAIKTIGVGVDGSDEARVALDTAAALARLLGATVRAMSVVEVASKPGSDVFGAPDPTGEEPAGTLRNRARELLEGAVRATRDMPQAEVAVLDGSPVDALADASRELDLLVVGSRAYGPLRRVLLGGVGSALMQRSSCPLIVVPRGVRAPFAGHADAPAPAS